MFFNHYTKDYFIKNVLYSHVSFRTLQGVKRGNGNNREAWISIFFKQLNHRIPILTNIECLKGLDVYSERRNANELIISFEII